MSDYIIKIIPTDPFYHVAEQNICEIVRYLKSEIRADKIDAKKYETPVFVDCGSNLEKIVCPLCGATVDFGWWSESMNAARDKGFMELSVNLPCCGRRSTLNDLRYHFSCGFSCVEFSILNPLNEPNHECLAHIQKMLGKPIRLIQAHI